MLRLVKAESFKLSKKLKSWLGPLLIMVLVLIAFPLSIDISQFDLDRFYFSIIIVSLLMTSFVATEGMFEEDFEDGSLEQEFLIEKDFYKLVLSKIFVYVCLIGIPIAFIGALFSFANGVAIDSFPKVFLILSISNLLLFNRFDKFVTYPFDRLKKFITHLFSKFSNVNVYSSVTYYDLASPNVFHDFFSFNYLVWFRCQKIEEFKFFSG